MQEESFEHERQEAALIESLKKIGATVEQDPLSVRGAYILSFKIEKATVTIRIELQDASGADLVITNMTTLPDTEKKQGYGSRVVQSLVVWSKENNLNNIRAVQIQQHNESFWQSNGFMKAPDKNPSNDFVYDQSETP